jgi:hypothetical protein
MVESAIGAKRGLYADRGHPYGDGILNREIDASSANRRLRMRSAAITMALSISSIQNSARGA